ncbi:hypothetical protein D3C87_190370 [compost metagenome]
MAGVLTSSLLISAGCGQFSIEEGQWASGDPDSSQGGVAPEPPVVIPDPPETDIGSPNPPATTDVYFSFKSGTSQLAHGPGKVWDGCAKTAMVKGGYNSDTKCGNGTVLPKYAEHLNKHFFGCVETAAADANFKQPERIFIRHWGTYVDRDARGSTSLSMHAYARAIDIVKFILYDRTGAATQVSTHVRDFKGATAKFYNSFRQCWKETLPSACRPGQREYSGSIGIPGSALGGNSLHNDHIHLSFPFCAG